MKVPMASSSSSHIFFKSFALQPTQRRDILSLCSPPPIPTTQFNAISIPNQIHHHSIVSPHKSTSISRRILCLSRTNLSSSSTEVTPPVSKEEAINQAKVCLSSTLQKPLNNPIVLPRQKLRKQKQSRFRVEIPVIDESTESLSKLAYEIFFDLPITRKGAKPRILLLWPDSTPLDSVRQLFDESSSESHSHVTNSTLTSVNSGTLNSADLVAFVSPEPSALDQMRIVCEDSYPKPSVLFNPKWAFEEEPSFGRELGSFAGSFEVIYSFLGLEVKGILSRRKGVVFRSVKDGVLSGEEWLVFVEDEENNGQLKMVSRFKKRPAIGDVESVLYNLMAANSPVTKSVKFLRDLASNLTGKKQNQ